VSLGDKVMGDYMDDTFRIYWEIGEKWT